MAELILFRWRQFRECFLQGSEVEDRIVTEPTVSLRRFEKLSVHSICDDRQRPSFTRQRNRANKMRRAIPAALTTQFAEQLGNSFCIGGGNSRVASGMYARRAAERRHNQPRIVRKHRSIRQTRIVQRFPYGILRDGGFVFTETGKGIESRQQFNRNTSGLIRRGKRLKFRNFSRIG